jgi:c-di-GMP-binding flagellar brake protein YcgR
MVIFMQREDFTINRSLFRINQRIDISLTKDIIGEFYHSRIEEITDKYILIAMPMSKGFPIFLAKGGTFYGKAVHNTSVYQFTSKLVEKRAFPIPVWVIAEPYDVIKIQNRAFVRIDARIQVKLRVVLENDNFEVVDASTKDISGGGILVVSKDELRTGTYLKLSIDIPAYETVHCNGLIVRVEKPQEDLSVYWAAIRFTDIAECERSKIIKYIFKKQLERRQRGY